MIFDRYIRLPQQHAMLVSWIGREEWEGAELQGHWYDFHVERFDTLYHDGITVRLLGLEVSIFRSVP